MSLIYISGPMTGLPDFNRPAFNAYADKLRREGRPHFNPAENGVALDAPWVDHMREDIRALMLCDEIHLLPGWQNSRGARIELDLAVALGLRVWEVPL